MVSSKNPKLLGQRLTWGRQRTFCESSAKVLVANRCVLEIAKGTKLVFLDDETPCGGLLLLTGRIRLWPLCPMVVATKTGQVQVRIPSELRPGPKGPTERPLGPKDKGFEPMPLPEIRATLDLDALLPTGKNRSGDLSVGSSGSVSAVGGGSMCLDTSGGSGAAGSVEQGPTTIQKPTPKARVILKVEVPR